MCVCVFMCVRKLMQRTLEGYKLKHFDWGKKVYDGFYVMIRIFKYF